MDGIDNDTVRDSSAYDNHGSMENNPTVVEGIVGDQALEFDGGTSDQYVYIDNSNFQHFGTEGDFSISAWATTTSSQETLWTYFYGNHGHGRFVLYSDEATLYTGDTYLTASDSSGLDGHPHLFSAIYSRTDGEIRFAVDDDVKDTVDWNGDIENEDDQGFFIGVMPRSTHTRHLNGKADDVRIYDRTLSENEIKRLYNMRSPRPRTWNLGKGLVGHWTMDNQDTDDDTLRDRTAIDGHGDINGATTGADSIIGEALSFDGTDNVKITDGYNLKSGENLTFSCWIYRTGTGASSDYLSILNNTEDGPHNFSFFVQDSGHELSGWLRHSDGSGAWSIPDGSVVQTNTWYHVVYVVDQDNNDFTMYLDTEVDSTGDLPTEVFQGVTRYTIGQFADRSNQYSWEGRLSDMRLYNRVLSEEEIKRLYNKRD